MARNYLENPHKDFATAWWSPGKRLARVPATRDGLPLSCLERVALPALSLVVALYFFHRLYLLPRTSLGEQAVWITALLLQSVTDMRKHTDVYAFYSVPKRFAAFT